MTCTDSKDMMYNGWQHTVYQPVAQPVVLPASLAKHPQQWSKHEVGVWLKWCSEEYSIDHIPPDKIDMNGKALCLLGREDFMARIPKNGDLLYNALQKLVQRNPANLVCSPVPTSYRPSILPPVSTSYSTAAFQQNRGDTNPNAGLIVLSSSDSSHPTTTSSPALLGHQQRPLVTILPQPPKATPLHLHNPTVANHNTPNLHQNDVLLPPTSVPGVLSPAPTIADTDSASDEEPVTDPDEAEKIHEENNLCDTMAFPPNMPSALSSGDSALSHSLMLRKQDSECRLLWEFIYQLLQNPQHYSNYVCWENTHDYVFRIINPTGLAQLWGHQKNRTNMTYEKLSRALRYYYRMNIIKKVSGRRLTYQFLQAPSKIQKGQRGAKPHSKTISPPHTPVKHEVEEEESSERVEEVDERSQTSPNIPSIIKSEYHSSDTSQNNFTNHFCNDFTSGLPFNDGFMNIPKSVHQHDDGIMSGFHLTDTADHIEKSRVSPSNSLCLEGVPKMFNSSGVKSEGGTPSRNSPFSEDTETSVKIEAQSEPEDLSMNTLKRQYSQTFNNTLEESVVKHQRDSHGNRLPVNALFKQLS
ncbi:transcription factor ETV6-like isoform X2 [Mizuhopecten yessoensis]|uniref:transcription factor ETV6-like isoform X2 n=1 Tax=Mizuhopecten yessoensis TaxID=6573 RepID=UPI000B457D2C|nr:transcription factor ETV6-like isoform X2 [Mizuhopecten yessoensis]